MPFSFVNEFVDIEGKPKTTYRSDYLLGYILTDYLRHKLILQRMGKAGIKFLENEIIRLIVHSILHLLGYNDDTKERKEEMFLKQEDYIKQLSNIKIL